MSSAKPHGISQCGCGSAPPTKPSSPAVSKTVGFDPVNRDAAHNRQVFDAVKNGVVDTVTCNNVLNVIQEPEARSNVILQAAKALKPGGTAYFTVYEGDGSGNGRQSQPDAWQEYRKTADYIDEIKQHFADVSVKNKVISARSPITDGKTSAWAMDSSFENPLRFSAGREVRSERVTNLLKLKQDWMGQAALLCEFSLPGVPAYREYFSICIVFPCVIFMEPDCVPGRVCAINNTPPPTGSPAVQRSLSAASCGPLPPRQIPAGRS